MLTIKNRQATTFSAKPPHVVCAQGKDDGAFVEFEADGDRFSLESLLQGTYPRLNGFWCVVETAVLSLLGARSL